MKSIARSLTTALALVLAATAARGDIIHLTGGRTLEGKLLQNTGTEVLIQLGDGTIRLPVESVVKIEPGDSPQEQYERRVAKLPDTAEAHVELAKWCQGKYLNDEARQHFMRAVELDGENAEARAGLGLVKSGNEWVTREEARQRRRAELEIEGRMRDQKYVMRATQYKDRFLALRREAFDGWFYSDAAQQARAEVLAVRDPAAVEPLLDVFAGARDENLRLMTVETLTNIPGDNARLALLRIATTDPQIDVVRAAQASLDPSASPRVAAEVRTILRSGSEQARNRVAPLAVRIGDAGTVLNLINNLITIETRVIHHAIYESQRSWISTGTTQAYVADLTPVVAQAAVGFRPTIGVIMSGSVLDVRATVQPWDERISMTIRHPEALEALRQISGLDFGYDVRAWRAWYQVAYRSPSTTPTGNDATGQ